MLAGKVRRIFNQRPVSSAGFDSGSGLRLLVAVLVPAVEVLLGSAHQFLTT
jgi:hypothetical protein